ncbi:pentapeptide repeat-containing protein [Spirosoma knui]
MGSVDIATAHMEYYKHVFEPSGELPDNWTNHEFEQCLLRKLDLSRATLAKSNFIGCSFEECNLTNVSLREAKLYDVNFIACTLTHVDFGHCNPFGFHTNFRDCQLDYTVFINRRLKKARFVNCSLKEAYFLKCELNGSVFDTCDLELTRFESNDLSQVDFSSSFNLKLDPDLNKVKKAKFSLYNLPGLLSKYELVIKG